MSDGALEQALDDPVGASLRGAHAGLARTVGRAVAYRPDVASFCAVPPRPTPQDWDDLARLLGPGGFADLFSSPARPPAGWAPVFALAGLQLVGPTTAPTVTTSPGRIVELGDADVDDMTALVEATRPGPFWPRTVELGTYLGVRDASGALVAMAGERLRPPGATEISAVCTAPQARGRGYAAALVLALVERIAVRGERAFLHVAGDNVAARRLYERLGFTVRREVTFHGHTVPDGGYPA